MVLSVSPSLIIADDGDGLRAGHQLVFPQIPCDQDHFHLIKTLQECRQFFANRLKSTLSHQQALMQKMEKAKVKQHSQPYSRPLGMVKQQTQQLQSLSQTLNILISWLEHDVLNKPGAPLSIRQELYDFIVAEFEKLEVLHPHRLRAVRITLQNQRDSLLAFTSVLNEKFKLIAEQFHYPLEKIWALCELQRCEHSSDQYGLRSLPLQDYFQAHFDAIEDAVIQALDSTERTSSMVENLNSRLSAYFFLRREIGHGYLNLLQFYFNHAPFLRSENPKRMNKTPAELLTGKSHPHWLEMLGFQRFKRAA